MSSLFSVPSGLPFPERNEQVRATWRPLYIEPMVGSGERVCIGVGVAATAGHIVVPVIGLGRLKCVYGEDVDALISAADIALRHLQSQFDAHGALALSRYEAPVEGIYAGDQNEMTGPSLELIARSALMVSASLVEQLGEADEEEDSIMTIGSNKLEQMVKEKVIAARPALEVAFGRERRLGANVRPARIGFAGRILAANFGVLMPHQLSNNVKDVKAKLWDLAQLREDFGQESNSLFAQTIVRYEMLVHRPAENDPGYSDRQMQLVREAENELEAEADKKELRCKSMVGPDAMATYVLQAEAA